MRLVSAFVSEFTGICKNFLPFVTFGVFSHPFPLSRYITLLFYDFIILSNYTFNYSILEVKMAVSKYSKTILN